MSFHAMRTRLSLKQGIHDTYENIAKEMRLVSIVFSPGGGPGYDVPATVLSSC